MISAHPSPASAIGADWELLTLLDIGFYRFGMRTPVLWCRCTGQGRAAYLEGLSAGWVISAYRTAIGATGACCGCYRFETGTLYPPLAEATGGDAMHGAGLCHSVRRATRRQGDFGISQSGGSCWGGMGLLLLFGVRKQTLWRR